MSRQEVSASWGAAREMADAYTRRRWDADHMPGTFPPGLALPAPVKAARSGPSAKELQDAEVNMQALERLISEPHTKLVLRETEVSGMRKALESLRVGLHSDMGGNPHQRMRESMDTLLTHLRDQLRLRGKKYKFYKHVARVNVADLAFKVMAQAKADNPPDSVRMLSYFSRNPCALLGSA